MDEKHHRQPADHVWLLWYTDHSMRSWSTTPSTHTHTHAGCFSGLLTSFKVTEAVVQCWGCCSGCGSLCCSRVWARWVSSRLSPSGPNGPSGPRLSVFDQPIDVMLGAVLAGGHLKDVGYAEEGFQCVSVGNHLRTQEREAHPVHA